MKKHILLVLVSTFIFGFVTGVLIFLQNNTGKEGAGALTGTHKSAVTAYKYGSCDAEGCPSFHIEENGNYTYITHDTSGTEKKTTGTLESNDKTKLFTTLKEVNLKELQGKRDSTSCGATRGGLAYRYEVSYKGEYYTFDSCTQNISNNTFFSLVNEYFEIFSFSTSSDS